MTIVMMAFACVGLSACSSDDDDNGGGSGSNSSSGVTVSAKYGYYTKESGDWCFWFFNKTPGSDGWFSGNVEMVMIAVKSSSSTIPEGEFSGNFEVEVSKSNASTQTATYWESGSESETTGKVTIKKSGSGYTISYTGVTLYEYDDNDKRVNTINNCSFSYTGSLTQLPSNFLDDDDDK